MPESFRAKFLTATASNVEIGWTNLDLAQSKLEVFADSQHEVWESPEGKAYVDAQELVNLIFGCVAALEVELIEEESAMAGRVDVILGMAGAIRILGEVANNLTTDGLNNNGESNDVVIWVKPDRKVEVNDYS